MDKPAGSDIGVAPTSRERRELVARGQRLKAIFTVGRPGLTDAFVAGVRESFRKVDLIKVRVDADNAEDTTAVATELARRVPCHFLQRVGRVALMYLPRAVERE